MAANGHPKFRAAQVFDWLYKKKVSSLDEMKNVPGALRELIGNVFAFTNFEVAKKQVASDGTMKLLFKLEDGNLIESVLMKHKHGYSVCVTTQVGCRIGCSFCASGLEGLTRNLSTGEIVAQVVHVEREIEDVDARIGNVVVMGIGEPFDNYESLTQFIKIINHDKGLNIGSRHITVSTSGIVPKIRRFAEDHNQVTLAISLHAPNDSLRSKIMQVNKAYPIKDLMREVENYIKMTNRRVTFEYALMKEINDSDDQARQLAGLLRGLNCHVNLIPINRVEELGIRRPDMKRIKEFEAVLEKSGINVTQRRSLGANIDAACGQLRAKNE